jgi:hypothetical protein
MSESEVLALAAFQDILRNSNDYFQVVMAQFSPARASDPDTDLKFLLTEKEVIEFKNCEGNVEKCIDFASKRFRENKAFAFSIINYLNAPKLDPALPDKFANFEIIESPFIVFKHLPSVQKFLKVRDFKPYDMSYLGEAYFEALEENLKENMEKGVSKVSKDHLAYTHYKMILNKQYEFINKKYTELEKTSQLKQDLILLIEKIGNLTILVNWLKKIEITFFTYPEDTAGYCFI